jgi:hypothetical protein
MTKHSINVHELCAEYLYTHSVSYRMVFYSRSYRYRYESSMKYLNTYLVGSTE